MQCAEGEFVYKTMASVSWGMVFISSCFMLIVLIILTLYIVHAIFFLLCACVYHLNSLSEYFFLL